MQETKIKVNKMKTYKEWLEEFRTKITEGYEKYRLDKKLAKSVYDAGSPVTVLLKGSGPKGMLSLVEGQQLQPYVLSTRNVTPLNIGFTIDMKDWADEPERYGMDMFMMQIGEIIAEREAYVIVKGMLDNAGYSVKVEAQGRLSKSDIKKAEDWIRNQGGYADTIILHCEQEMQFRLKGELLEPHLIPTSYVPQEDRGPYFSGKINGLNVYWMRFNKGIAVVYNKDEIILAKTSLKIEFDSLDHPTKLILERWCSSAPIDERGVVKIIL
jgi:hypothetical protein